MALYCALTEVFDDTTPYEQVVVFRSAVETRPIGFLPGTEREKQEPYETTYADLMSDLLPYKNSYTNLKALGYLDFRLTSHVRGVTFYNSIVCVEEVQNMDAQEILSVLTRIGPNSRIIITGDSKQDDLFRQKNGSSGFHYLEQLMALMPAHMSDVIAYTTDDVVRSELCKQIIIADSKIPN